METIEFEQSRLQYISEQKLAFSFWRLGWFGEETHRDRNHLSKAWRTVSNN